ncbi:MAG: AlpA family transcriptional regulator [Pseudomonas sp.]|nr:AlpA family transcriptional regulator [Pseudomonas sp.]
MGRIPKTFHPEPARKVEIRTDQPAEPAEPAEQSIQFIRLPEVKRITGMSTTTIYEMANKGDFPRQVRLGIRAAAWVKSEVLAWSNDKVEKSRKPKT